MNTQQLLQESERSRKALLSILEDQKRIEGNLRKSEAYNRLLFNSSPIGLVLCKMDGSLVDVNPAYANLLGRTVEETLKLSYWDITPKKYEEQEKQQLKSLDETGRYGSYEKEYIHKDGHLVPVRLHGLIIEREGEKFIWSSVEDITERNRAEEEIKLTNKELETINKIIASATSTFDLKLILDKVMDEALNVVGLEGGTVCLINPDNTFELAVEKGATQETIEDLTNNKIKVGDCLCGNCAKECKPLILQTKEDVLEYATREVLRGEDIRFHAAFPFVIGEKCVGVLCVFTRTDKKPLERNLKLLESIVAQTAIAIENSRLYEEVKKHTLQLEHIVSERTAELQSANKELEAFSYSVSHDLRAPLRAIDGFSLALLEDYSDKLDNEGKHHLQRVRNGATEMAQLIDDLLNLSRISRRELIRGSVDMSKIVKSITDKLNSSETDRKAVFNIADNIQAAGDSNLLKIVMENLLNNAWKFTSKRKNVSIEFGILEKEGKTVYYIKDNGVGFDMKYADKLFNPFQRLHRKEDYPGTGIGLATVRRIILKHGGSIWAESELGKGAAFYFTL
ncbi:MAG: PAS domain S-box protein [Bacteroidota bacterium]|nr:PAS domain S-box protein [Bacteroidota bacterium]